VTIEYAIEAEGLHKSYGATRALRGVDLAVPRGSVCGLLGPNGAGKTTAVRILTTLSTPDAGWARVAGLDVAADARRVRETIGLASQDATVDELLSARQNLVMVGELHHVGRRAARRRAEELLEQFSLVDARDRLAKDLSGGMRRRLDLAATLVAHPQVLFLDEPTTGLDPRARNELWAVLDTLVGEGTTILLTTQYLEEADRLAREIVVVDHGLVIARGDSRSLKRRIGRDQLLVVPVEADDLERTGQILERATGHTATLEPATRRAWAPTEDGVAAVASVAAELQWGGIEVEDLGLRQPSLDDVFLTLTGTAAEPPEPREIEEAVR
jgi:ABC-2 type transport system ATP-binding protein